jgi:hypothetical protein
MLEGKFRLMLRWISIFGGLLIMMGHHVRSEALFYYFRLEDQVPENHLLRQIDKHSCSQYRNPGSGTTGTSTAQSPYELVIQFRRNESV